MLRAYVDFSKNIRPWDGFGLQYVETVDTVDIKQKPQDCGGYSLLKENRNRINDLLFGSEGPRPAILRIFLDPFHQPQMQDTKISEDEPVDFNSFNHIESTGSTREFCSDVLSKVRSWGGDLRVMVTCLCPPGWMTKQNVLSGRDLDLPHRINLARYMISWVKFLKDKGEIPVNYLSIHNQGESWDRWDSDGKVTQRNHNSYNLYWPPEQVTDFLKLLRRMLNNNSLQEINLTPGETSNWVRFHEWGYANAIYDDPQALASLGLITSNGFSEQNPGKSYGDWRSAGVDLLHEKNPLVHAWVTSTDTSGIDCELAWEFHNHIYGSKVNAIISGNAIHAVNGGANSSAVVSVNRDGSFETEKRFYYFKSVCRAGQPGMSVCQVVCNSPEIVMIGFANNMTRNPDSFVVVNISDNEIELPIEIRGTACSSFLVFRTSPSEDYIKLGSIPIREGKVRYRAMPQSVTTFFGNV